MTESSTPSKVDFRLDLLSFSFPRRVLLRQRLAHEHDVRTSRTHSSCRIRDCSSRRRPLRTVQIRAEETRKGSRESQKGVRASRTRRRGEEETRSCGECG